MSPGEVCVSLILNHVQIFFISAPLYSLSSLCVCVCPGQAEEVFSNMAGDFMRPVVDIVDQLLTAGVNVTIYNGQLDLIVDTMGNSLCITFCSALAPVSRSQQELWLRSALSLQVRSCGWNSWSGTGYPALINWGGPPWMTPPHQASLEPSTRPIRTLPSIGSSKLVTW